MTMGSTVIIVSVAAGARRGGGFWQYCASRASTAGLDDPGQRIRLHAYLFAAAAAQPTAPLQKYDSGSWLVIIIIMPHCFA